MAYRKNALSPLGQFIAGFSHPVDAPAIVQAARRTALLDRATGDYLEAPVAPTYLETDNVVVDDVSSLPEVQGMATIEAAGGAPKITIGLRNDVDASDLALESLESSINLLVDTAEGRSLIRALGSSANLLQDAAANDATWNGANPLQQAAIRSTQRQLPKIALGAAAGNQVFGNKKQDAARTSMEYHEWKYNLIDTGKNWDVIRLATGMQTTEGFEYIKADKISPKDSPPYYQWIEHFLLRRALNVVKRWRRHWSTCGSKRILEFEGLTKEQRIGKSVAMDGQYTSARDTLVITADYQLTS